MTSRDFCYWLQGFFEVVSVGVPANTKAGLVGDQVECIKQHLAMVFKHEIDPSYGDKAHQEELDAIHAPNKPVEDKAKVYRC